MTTEYSVSKERGLGRFQNNLNAAQAVVDFLKYAPDDNALAFEFEIRRTHSGWVIEVRGGLRETLGYIQPIDWA